MRLWSTREVTLAWLKGQLKNESEVIDEGFLLLDECIDAFDETRKSSIVHISAFSEVCGFTAAKARNLLLGCYSLSIDALSQESGALLRPLIETNELLTYFRLDPSRISQARNNQLPKAGIIAQKINGQFQGLRNYLSDNASHFGFTMDSTLHLYDFNADSFRTVANHYPERFKYNISLVFIFTYFVLVECVYCLGCAQVSTDNIGHRIQKWYVNGMKQFGLDVHIDIQ